MKTKDAIRAADSLSTMVLNSYISDLDDGDLMRRPGAGCNHLAWQLGHLISSEVHLLEGIVPGKSVALPEGFDAAHSKDNRHSDDPSEFLSKTAYQDLLAKVHAATLSALESFPEADLDQPAPENYRSFCPTMGDMFVLIATHPMMHAGQFVVVRRQLDKPVLI
jgi:hypothetical protein